MKNVSIMPAGENLNPEQALNDCLNYDLQDVLIVGYDDEGALFIRSSKISREQACYLLLHALDHAKGTIE